jgi:hypothetical protein
MHLTSIFEHDDGLFRALDVETDRDEVVIYSLMEVDGDPVAPMQVVTMSVEMFDQLTRVRLPIERAVPGQQSLAL